MLLSISKELQQLVIINNLQFKVLGATVSVLMIWVITGILVYVAINRVAQGDFEVDATIMLITSGVGVGVNIM